MIILNICRLNDMAQSCPTIEWYCKNCKKFLLIIFNHLHVNRERAKYLMLRLSYGGEYTYWMEEQENDQLTAHTFLKEVHDYETEMETIRNIVFKICTYKSGSGKRQSRLF